MKKPKKLKKADYATLDERGVVTQLHCKVCSKALSFWSDQHKRMNLAADYAELKMRMTDGSFHVTNLCHGCLNGISEDKELLQELHDADMVYLGSPEAMLARVVDSVVKIELRQRGII